MKVLLLGGMGYIGSTLCDYLSKNTEHRVTVVDNLQFNVNPNFFYELLNHERIRFIKGDIANMALVYPLIKKHDIVIDLAALTLPISADNPDTAIMINQHMAEIIGDSCKKLGKRMIFLSTCSNYGKSTKLVDEEAQLFPVSIYAISKVNAEKYLLKNVPDITILRCATAYGLSPGNTRWDVILNDFVETAVREGSIDVFQPGAHRPIVHVKDISKAIALVIEANNLKHKVYNIGDVNYTKKDLVKLVVKQTGAKVKYVENDDNRDYKVNFKRAFDELGFEVTRDIKKEICDMIKAVRYKQWCGG